MKLADKTFCTGCGACKAICHEEAISMAPDWQGFPCPTIEESKCLKCRACERVCPVLNEPQMNSIKVAFAAQIKDKAVLLKSTSGGLFTALSREIFRRDGVVYGCVWNERCEAVYARAEKEEDIEPMRGSKYVYSRAFEVFSDILRDLKEGKTVLFVGTPCQAAGLKCYLHRDYETLFILDFLCSGMPSPFALDKYLDTVCEKEERPTLNLKFRDKNPYGLGVHITWSGHETPKVKKAEHIRNPYYYSFYTKLIDRDSCYSCPYGGGQRVADLTMGDYWGIGVEHPEEFKVLEGVSALLVNSANGEKLLSSVSSELKLVETTPEKIGKANNLFVARSRKNVIPENREAFFNVLSEYGWAKAEKKYLHSLNRRLRIVKAFLPPKVTSILVKLMK